MKISMTWRRISMWLCIGLIALLTAACGTVTAPPETESPSAPAAEGSGVDAPAVSSASDTTFSGELVINTWGDIAADPNHPSYALHELIQQWAASHPDVTVTYQPMLGTVPERFGYISTNLRSQTLADVVMQYFPSPAQLDVDLQYDFSADLDQPNPYSDNPTWREDSPLGAVALRDVTVDGKALMIGTTYSGDLGDTAVLYNKDILEQAGVEQLPQTWAEFYDAMAAIKEAGYQPFYMPTTGTDGYIFTWYVVLTSAQLMGDIVAQCDGQAGEEQNGVISQKEAIWCIDKGIWNARNPGVVQTFEEIKKWSEFFHEGYLAPSAPGNLFAQGKIAFLPTVRLVMGIYENDPNMTFEWGSFYLPALQDGETAPRLGNSGAGQGSQYLFIPKTTVDKGKLEMARDLLYYVTSPAAIEYWCAKQPVPCFAPGTPLEEIIPGDPVKQARYHGFIDPPTLDNMVSRLDANNVFGPAIVVQETQILQDYLAGNADLEQTLDKYQAFLDQQASNVIMQHPEWNADSW
jgi:ABC-type glycerol-3-phosphate transport system substrate-binding protein